MILLELFNDIYKYKNVDGPANIVVYEFWADPPAGSHEDDAKSYIDVRFSRSFVLDTNDICYHLMFNRNDDYGIQNNATDAIKIFATVIDIIEKFRKDYKPKMLIFSAKTSESSRIKLYDRLVKKIKNFVYFEDLDKDKYPHIIEELKYLSKRYDKDKFYAMLNKDGLNDSN